MTEPTTCPKCGAKQRDSIARIYETAFDCGSATPTDLGIKAGVLMDFSQSKECRICELESALAAANERCKVMEEALTRIASWGPEQELHDIFNTKHNSEIAKEALAQLKPDRPEDLPREQRRPMP